MPKWLKFLDAATAAVGQRRRLRRQQAEGAQPTNQKLPQVIVNQLALLQHFIYSFLQEWNSLKIKSATSREQSKFTSDRTQSSFTNNLENMFEFPNFFFLLHTSVFFSLYWVCVRVCAPVFACALPAETHRQPVGGDRGREEICDLICSPRASSQNDLTLSSIIAAATAAKMS